MTEETEKKLIEMAETALEELRAIRNGVGQSGNQQQQIPTCGEYDIWNDIRIRKPNSYPHKQL